MFRVLDLPRGGAPVVREGDDTVAPPPPGTIRWIDLVAPDPRALELLRERFGFDNLAIADCARFGRQSKLDDYGAYLFVVVHAFSEQPAAAKAADPELAADALAIQIHEIHAFFNESYLVTVHDNALPAAESVWQLAARDRATLERGPSWVLFRAVVEMLEEAEPLVERITDDLDAVERALVAGGEEIDLPGVFAIKRSVVAMRRVLRPLRDTLAAVQQRAGDPRLTPRAALHFRDAADRARRLVDMVEEARDVAATVLNANAALVAQKTNVVMKRLTVFSAVFLPLSFIVGFFGQNFTGMPFDSTAWLAVMLASMVVVPAGLVEWFKRNDWL
jgi:magnesium transporter